MLLFAGAPGKATVAVDEVQDDDTASDHVDNLRCYTSDQEAASSIQQSHIATVTGGGETGDGAAGYLDEDAREVCPDEHVRVPLRLKLRVLLAAIEDDVLEHHRDRSGDERGPDEQTGQLHRHRGGADVVLSQHLPDTPECRPLTSKDLGASSDGRHSR